MLKHWTRKRIVILAALLIPSTALIAGYLSYLVTAVNRDKKNLALHGVVVKAAIVKVIHQSHGDDYRLAFNYKEKPYVNLLTSFRYKLNVGDSLQIKIDPKDPTGYCEYAY
jgi:hypothetical protein